MLVCPRFDGDDDLDLQWAQHDVYGRALKVLVGGAQSRLAEAERLTRTSSSLGDIVARGRFDHHVVQDAHDLLAAIWRLTKGYCHPALPGIRPSTDALVHDWLDWLARWTRDADPDVIEALLQVAFRDPSAGHAYELLLLERLGEELRFKVDSRG